MFHLSEESFGYRDTPVLKKISLQIQPGEKVALVGESGSGKSTLLSLLYQRHRPDCAYVPQEPALVRSLSVFHNVYMGQLDRHNSAYNLLNLAWPRKKQVAAIRTLLKSLGLEDKIFTRAGELSGGQQQRTAVCRALFQGGPALLADEPVSAADLNHAEQSLSAMTAHFETLILAMHDVDLALAYTQRVIGIRHGRVVLDAPTQGLTRQDLAFVYRDAGAEA